MTSKQISQKLKIIPRDKPFKITLTNRIIWLIILTYFILFLLVKDTNNIIGISFLCTVVVILVTISLMKKRHEYSKDYLTINEKTIETFINNKTTIYPITDIESVFFLYYGYKGEYNPITKIAHSGFENKIRINTQEYNIFITTDNIEFLNYTLRRWKKENINFLAKDYWGNTITEIK